MSVVVVVDNLKLIGTTGEELQKTYANRNFSDDIDMELGLERYTKIEVHLQNLVIDISRGIEELEQGKA
jgi:hypothetical protein